MSHISVNPCGLISFIKWKVPLQTYKNIYKKSSNILMSLKFIINIWGIIIAVVIELWPYNVFNDIIPLGKHKARKWVYCIKRRRKGIFQKAYFGPFFKTTTLNLVSECLINHIWKILIFGFVYLNKHSYIDQKKTTLTIFFLFFELSQKSFSAFYFKVGLLYLLRDLH